MNERNAALGAGLSQAEVAASRRTHGSNVLTPPAKTPLWRLYLDKYNDPIIRILLVAAAVSLLMAFVEGEYVETIGIILAIFFATTVGFYFERDAARKFDVLTQMNEEQAVKVRREGRVQTVARRDVVVGDLVLLEVGDEVPADGELLEAVDLHVDESALTGEPIADKQVGGAADAGGWAFPPNVVLRSSMVIGGRGVMRVTAVGDATEIGRVARTSTEETQVKTPLNEQLSRLASLISRVGMGVSVAAFALFLGRDMLTDPLWHTADYLGMASRVLRYFMVAVTLIVMAVPEGLPMAVTLALALNMRRMLKSHNLVRKLHACETMGAVTVICTDKTGTLTQNRMTVADVWTEATSEQLCQSMALNTTAHLNGEQGIGNPTEVALLRWVTAQGADYATLRQAGSIVTQEPFSTERKYMLTVIDCGQGPQTLVKGAPEVVMQMCTFNDDATRQAASQWLATCQRKAMRTLALARNGRLEVLVAISDPLRTDVPQAVAQCRRAGIEVKIVTGDTSATALEIARQIGIVDDVDEALHDGSHIGGADFAALADDEALRRVGEIKVMSRARPADKQRLVSLLQQRGEIVAVTGDGTNDAPALNHAHVGLSLGSGTSVAKQASDITLLDDSFRSIVSAVVWGRSLYKNIQRFLFFQLVVNVTALLLVLGGALVGTELPLTVTQILWVNLIMDTFAAMALASLPPSREVLGAPPRSRNAFIISRAMARAIGFVGGLFFVLTFALLLYVERTGVQGISRGELTAFFTVFVMLQWWNLFNAKALGSSHSAFRYLLRCRGMLLVLAMTLVGQWLIVQFGGDVFRTQPLPWATWLAIVVATAPVALLGEIYRLVRRMRNERKDER